MQTLELFTIPQLLLLYIFIFHQGQSLFPKSMNRNFILLFFILPILSLKKRLAQIFCSSYFSTSKLFQLTSINELTFYQTFRKRSLKSDMQIDSRLFIMYRLGSTVITIQQIFSAGKYYKIYDFYNMIGLVSVRFGQKFWPNQTFFFMRPPAE